MITYEEARQYILDRAGGPVSGPFQPTSDWIADIRTMMGLYLIGKGFVIGPNRDRMYGLGRYAVLYVVPNVRGPWYAVGNNGRVPREYVLTGDDMRDLIWRAWNRWARTFS